MSDDVIQDARNSRLAELRAELDKLDAMILLLAEKEHLSDEEEAEWDELNAVRDTIKPEHDKLEAKAVRIQDIKARTTREIKGMPEVRRPVQELHGVDVRTLETRVARDGALRVLEDREEAHVLSAAQKDQIERLVRSDTDLARRVIVTENEHYRNAWHKFMMTEKPILTDDEHRAMLRFAEYRAQSEGVTTAGGFAVPVFIDPSIILTDQETDNPFLRAATVRNVTTNVWKGVSAAGISWSFDAEASAVSDDSITLAQPSVTVQTARGFIPYSIEVGEDWPGFQAEMARLLSEGYDELLIDKFTTGSGTNEPRGLITALDANTNVEVSVTTDGSFSKTDLYKVWHALPQKYRRNASWMGDVTLNSEIRNFGTTEGPLFTVDLSVGYAERLLGRPWLENDYMANFTGTTGAVNLLVIGDFRNYVIARRTGMNVELVPHLFDVTSNRPTGQRGWFAYARIGGNSVNDLAFRLLQNT